VPPGTANVEEELDKLTQAEAYIPRLRGLNEDESMKFIISNRIWKL
jgi:hypothetical protein